MQQLEIYFTGSIGFSLNMCFDTVSAPGLLLLEIVQFVQVPSKLHHLGMSHRYHIAKTDNPGSSS
jgi:hypothetical protein